MPFLKNTVYIIIAPLIISLGLVGCRIEIGLTPPVQEPEVQSTAVIFAPPIVERKTATPVPTSTPAATQPVSPAETATLTVTGTEGAPVDTLPQSAQVITPVSSPTPSPTPLPTPTPIPLIPAQSPPAKIIVPSIGLDAPVKTTGWEMVERGGVEVPVWSVPDDAAGWHINSALPGHGSNVVLSGHHNIGTEVFRFLGDLNRGDEIILKADGRDYYYQVTDRFILAERDAPNEQRLQNGQWILPTVDERLTLVTCWPYNDNSHRMIIIAGPVSASESAIVTSNRF